MKWTQAVAALALCALSGCGTVMNLSGMDATSGGRMTVYGGVKGDLASRKRDDDLASCLGLHCNSSAQMYAAFAVLDTLDVPLSAVADTLTLPITVPVELWRPPADPKTEPPGDPAPRQQQPE